MAICCCFSFHRLGVASCLPTVTSASSAIHQNLRVTMLATLLTLLPIFTSSMVINRITTTDDRELTYVSLAGLSLIHI